MFYGLGEFSKALDRGDERRRSIRKDNADMYSNFIRLNPGADTQERLDFANKLIKETGVGSGGLPTKSAMTRNYKKFQAEEAKKAAAAEEAKKEKARRREIENMRLASEVAPMIAGTWGTKDYEASRNSIYEKFGIDQTYIGQTDAATEQAAWEQWLKSNKATIAAFTTDKSQASYDALISEAGEVWGKRVSGSYGSILKSHLSEQTASYAAELENITQGATDIAEFNRQVEVLNGRYPASVRKRSGDNREVVLKRRKAQAMAKLEKARTTMPPERYAALKSEIIEQFDQAALPDFDDMDAIVEKNEADRVGNLKTTYEETLVQQAQLYPIDNPEVWNSYVSGVVEKAAKDGIVLNFAQIDATRNALKAQADEKLKKSEDQVVAKTVNNADEQIASIAAAARPFEDVIAEIEEDLSAELGRSIKLSNAQKADIQSKYTTDIGELTQIVQAHANTKYDNPKAYLEAIQKSKTKFVDNFVSQLVTQGITATDRHKEIAEEKFQGALQEIRLAANAEEAKKLNTAKVEMGDTSAGQLRGSFDTKKIIDNANLVLADPLIIGEDKDTNGVVKANIIQSVMSQVDELRAGVDFPMSDEFMNELFKRVNNGLLTDGNHKFELDEQGRIKRSDLVKAFVATFQTNGFNGSQYSQLEQDAFSLALQREKLTNMSEVFNLSVDEQAEFLTAYRTAREEVRTSTYDVLKDSYANDTEKTTVLLDQGNTLKTSMNDVIGVANSLTNMTFVQLSDRVASGDESLSTNIKLIDQTQASLHSQQIQLSREQRRLNTLLKNPLYAEHFAENVANVQRELMHLQGLQKELNQHAQTLQASKEKIISNIELGKAERVRLDKEEEAKRREASQPPITSSQQAALDAEQANADRLEAQRLEAQQQQAQLQAQQQQEATVLQTEVQKAANEMATAREGTDDAMLNLLLGNEELGLYKPTNEQELTFFKQDLMAVAEEGGYGLAIQGRIDGIVEAMRRRLVK